MTVINARDARVGEWYVARVGGKLMPVRLEAIQGGYFRVSSRDGRRARLAHLYRFNKAGTP